MAHQYQLIKLHRSDNNIQTQHYLSFKEEKYFFQKAIVVTYTFEEELLVSHAT